MKQKVEDLDYDKVTVFSNGAVVKDGCILNVYWFLKN